MKKIAVFASGGGTDFQSVIDANERENFCVIEYLVASKPEIGAINRAEKHGIEPLVFDKTTETKEEFYARIAKTLKAAGVEYIILAGWLLVVPASFIKEFENAIINIHPSLIPSFCGMGYYGLHVHEKAIEYGVKLTYTRIVIRYLKIDLVIRKIFSPLVKALLVGLPLSTLSCKNLKRFPFSLPNLYFLTTSIIVS
jgi:phosphoribosylglycinamide formyltransferase-1